MDPKKYLQFEPTSRHGLLNDLKWTLFSKLPTFIILFCVDIIFFQHGCQIVV